MNINECHIVCSTDDNYADYCSVMLFSLFENNKMNDVIVHVLINNLSDTNKQKIKSIADKFNQQIFFHNVDESKLEHVRFRKKNPLSKAAYYRILMASILPEDINVVLYLDCDLLVLKSVGSLFNIDLSNYALAAVKDQATQPVNEEHRLQLNFSYQQPYFCSGVMLINLAYWREYKVEPRLIEFAERERYVYFHDQDALNYLFAEKWFELSPQWNRFNLVVYNRLSFKTKDDELNYIYTPSIIHFASSAKPWLNIKFLNWKKIYKQYYKETFFDKLKEKDVKNKFVFYKVVFETNIVNFAYKSPLFIKIPLIAFINFFRIICALFVRKKIASINLYSYKV